MPKKKTTKRKTKVRVKQKQKQRQSQRVVVYVDRPRARRRTQKRRGRGLPSKPHWRGGVPPEMSSSRTAVYYINEGKHSSRRNDLLIAQNRQRDLQQERGTAPVQSFLNEIDKVIADSDKLQQSTQSINPPSPPSSAAFDVSKTAVRHRNPDLFARLGLHTPLRNFQATDQQSAIDRGIRELNREALGVEYLDQSGFSDYVSPHSPPQSQVENAEQMVGSTERFPHVAEYLRKTYTKGRESARTELGGYRLSPDRTPSAFGYMK